MKKQTYRYDPARLPYHPSFFETELISPTFTNTIWDAFTELTKQMDILEISRTGQWAIKVDRLQDGAGGRAASGIHESCIGNIAARRKL